MKRIISFVLCLSMLVSMVPMNVFASETEESMIAETVAETEALPETQAPETDPAPAETTGIILPEETEAPETEPVTVPETTVCTEVPDETAPTEAAVTVLAETGAPETEPEETEAEVTYTDTRFTIIPDASFPSSEEMFAAYVEHQFYGTGESTYSTEAGKRLSGDLLLAYNAIVPIVQDIASGERDSTVIKLGYNLGTVRLNGELISCVPDVEIPFSCTSFSDSELDLLLDALLSDLPYDLYWFDKTSGVSGRYISTSDGRMFATFSFTVSNDYSVGGANNTYVTDTALTGAAVTAAANAQAIVEEYAALSDYEKLRNYKDAICDRVAYNSSAASSSYSGGYGDPWQLIYVFDASPNTKVVCEGYTKAFQYLCDLSDFDADITCYNVVGTMSGGTGAGDHMWNIVRINGSSYLADITNSDTNTVGVNGGLFLVGGTPNSSGAYTFKSVTFTYGSDSTSLWGTGDDSILTLATENYDPNASTQEPDEPAAPPTTAEELLAAVNAGGSVTVWDHITITEDMTLSSDSELSFADYSSLTVTNGATLTLNCPTMINGAQLVVEQGSKLVNNVALNLANPQNNGGSAVFNGEFENNGQFWATTGSTADINGYAVSSGPIFVGFGGNSQLNINGQLDTTGYLGVDAPGSLNLPSGAKLNLLGQGGGYLDNSGNCWLNGDVYLEGLMTTAAKVDEETGERGEDAVIEIRGSLTGTDTSSIGVGAGGSIQCYGPVTTACEVVVNEGATLILNDTLSVNAGGRVDVYGTLEHNAAIENAGVVTVYGSYITGEGASTQLIGDGVLLLTAEDRFLYAIGSAEPGSEVIIRDHIVVTEDLTIQLDGTLSFADYSSLTVANGATLTLNCPTMINGAQLVVDQGSKLVNNVALNLANPQDNGGSAVFNGEFENNGELWVTTGSTADINGYAVSSGPIFVGFGGNSQLNINGQLDTTGYLCIDEPGRLNLSSGAKLNLLGQGGGYLDNAGYCYLGGDVYVEYMMTSGARTDEETGEVVGSDAVIEIRGSLTGTDTSSIGVGAGGSIQCYGPVTTAGEVVVGRDGAFWVDHTVTLTGPAPLTVDGWLHIDYFDEFADADGLLNLETTANVNGYLHVCDGGVLNVTDKAVLNILNDENGCGYLDNQGHVDLHGTMNLDGMFTTGPATDENGNVVGNPADTKLQGSISASDRSFIGVGTQGSLNCFGPVTTAGEVEIQKDGTLWVDNTVSITGPGALRNNGYLHVDYFDEFATADGVLNVDTETHVNGYLHVCDGGRLHMGENSTLGIYNNENGCGYLDNQGTAVMDGHLYLEGLFTTGAACDDNGNVVGAPASARFNWYVDTTETSTFCVQEGGTVTLFGVNNAGEFRTEDGGRLIFPDNGELITLTNHGGLVALAEDTVQFDGFNYVVNRLTNGSLGSISGVPYENLAADAYATSAEDVYTLFETASPEEYCDITVIVEASMVLNRDLTIPEVGYINLLAEEVPSLTVTIPEGVTVTNNGHICVLENTTLVINGNLEGNPPENMGGIITGKNGTVTVDRLEQLLEQQGFVELREKLVLNRDLTIPAGTNLSVRKGGQLIVPGGKKLIVEGELHILESVDKEGSGEAGLLMESGTLVNNGLIAVHDLGMLDASNGTYEQADWAELHRVYLGDDNDPQIPFVPSEIIGIPMSCSTIIADYTNPEVIRIVLAIADGAETAGDPFRAVHINIGRDMTLSASLTIPANGCMRIENSTVTVPAGFTLTNEGRIEIGWNGCLVIADGASLTGNQPMVTNGGEYVNTVPYTEADFRADLGKAAETGSELYLCRNLTLTEDLLIPAGVTLVIGENGKLIVPTGITLTVEGQLHITNSIDLGGIPDPGLLVDGGALVNNGLIVTRDYGILDAGNGTYEQADQAQLHRVYYSPDDGGDVFPSEVSGISGAYVDLIFDNVDGEVLPNLLKIPDQMLNNGDPFRSVQINITGWERKQYVDLTIPEYARMEIRDGGTLVVPSGVTLTNNGSIDIGWAGTLVIEEGGAIVGNHPYCYDTGSEYINENVYGQDYLEALLQEGQAENAPVVLSVPVTLERDLEIPADVQLHITGRDNFITIPEDVTLTNNGRIICQMFGGILGAGGEVYNCGTISVENWGTVDMSSGSYGASDEGELHNIHADRGDGNVTHATVLGVQPRYIRMIVETCGEALLQELIDHTFNMYPRQLLIQVMGDVTLTRNTDLRSFAELQICEGATLVIPEDVVLTVDGTLHVRGDLAVEGQLIHNGHISVSGQMAVSGSVTGSGEPVWIDSADCLINHTPVMIDTAIPGLALEDFTPAANTTVATLGTGMTVKLYTESWAPFQTEVWQYQYRVAAGSGYFDLDPSDSIIAASSSIVASRYESVALHVVEMEDLVIEVLPVTGYDDAGNPVCNEAMIRTVTIEMSDYGTFVSWGEPDFYNQAASDIDGTHNKGLIPGVYGGSSIDLTAGLVQHSTLSGVNGGVFDWTFSGEGAQFVTGEISANALRIHVSEALDRAARLFVTATPVQTPSGIPAAPYTAELILRPAADYVDVLVDDEIRTGETIIIDLNRDPDASVHLEILSGPEAAFGGNFTLNGDGEHISPVTWKFTNTRLITVGDYGNGPTLRFTGTGTVKATATADLGGRQTASVTFKIVALAQEIVPAENTVTQLIGGKSATYTVLGDGEKLKSSAVEWFLCDETGNAIASHPYASINAKGKLTTKAVADETTVYLMARVIGDENSARLEQPVMVTLYPAVTNVDVIGEDGSDTVLDGGKWLLDLTAGSTYQTSLNIYPNENAVKEIQWKSSKTSVATVQDGLITFHAAGTAKITATAVALDGKKTAVSFTFTAGRFVQDVELDVPDTAFAGEKITLGATVLNDADNTNITWSLANSADKAYATLTSAGKLTVKNVSNPVFITVRAQSKDGMYTEERMITLLPKGVTVDGVEMEALLIWNDLTGEFLTKTTKTVQPGAELYLCANGLVSWTSSKPSVAGVDPDTGILTAITKGSATITAEAEDGRKATFTVKVGKVSTQVSISAKNDAALAVASGKSLSLAASVVFSDGSTNKSVTWTIDDTSVAKISSSGKLTAVKDLVQPASVEVTATAKDGYAEATVTVEILPLTTGVEIYGPFDGRSSYDVDISNTTQVWDLTTQGRNFYLYAGVFPYEGMQDVTWKSSSAKVASIDADGRVTCLKSGTVTITATARDGSGKKASFKLTVVKTMAYLELPATASISGGKSLTMTKLEGYAIDTQATNKTLAWSMTDLNGNPVPKTLATLSNKGVLKTKAVTQSVDILVTAEATDGSGLTAECIVTISPAV